MEFYIIWYNHRSDSLLVRSKSQFPPARKRSDYTKSWAQEAENHEGHLGVCLPQSHSGPRRLHKKQIPAAFN